jgi:biopolymer transport protein ExbB
MALSIPSVFDKRLAIFKPIAMPSNYSQKGSSVKTKIIQLLAWLTCALSLAILPGIGHAQSVSAPLPQSVSNALAVPPVISDGTAADANAKKQPEATDNPYGIEALWNTSDGVAKTVLLLLLVMSISSWYVLIIKLLEQAKISRQAKAAAADFWSASSVQQGSEKLDANSPFRFIAQSGIDATKKQDGLMEDVDLRDWTSMSIQRAVESIQVNLQRGLPVLATVGSISPFVGLFGTVWGIYHALTAIGVTGQASIDKVAGPVGEALIMTAIGLAVAVPAVLGYNWLVGRNKDAMVNVRTFGSDLHVVLIGSLKKA